VSNLVNSASYQGGAVAPGEIVTVYDSNYGPANLVVSPSGTFPTNLGGVQVLFDGVPAPLLYASANSGVSVIVPFEVAGKQQTVVEYQYNPGSGTVSNTAVLPVAATAPAIFSLNEQGSGPGAVLNYPDYSVNSASNPVPAGGFIMVYGTGGGAVVGGATDGVVAPGAGKLVTQPVTATIGGVAANVLYAGPAPGQVNGLMQVNLQVPTGLAPGPKPVVITIGTAATQSGITVAVQ
jgi:trimeric autotransporter adhesin